MTKREPMPPPHDHLLNDLLDHVAAYVEEREAIHASTGPLILEEGEPESTVTQVKNLRETVAQIRFRAETLIEMLAAMLTPAPLHVELTHKRGKLHAADADPAIGGIVSLVVRIDDQPLDDDDQSTIYTRVKLDYDGKTRLEFPRLDRAREEE